VRLSLNDLTSGAAPNKPMKLISAQAFAALRDPLPEPTKEAAE
jgi:hypothetical protein